MKDLLEYLSDNKINHKEIDETFLFINEEKYKLLIPDDGIMMDDDFDLVGMEEEGVKYVYSFGGQWYFSSSTTKPDMNELKYIGKSTSKIPTNTFLGVHGAYEMLNGSRLYEDWVSKAKFMGVKVLGICEKNTLAGTLKFQLACLKKGIRPVIGATYTIFNQTRDVRYDVKCFVKSTKGWESILLINKEVLVINDKFINEDRFLQLTEGLIIVVDPKAITYGDTLALDLNVDNIYYQLDTVEFSDTAADNKYLLNLKEFFNSKFDPVSIRDAYYLDKEHSHIKGRLNLISGVFDQKSNNQYFKDNEDYFTELASLFSEEDDSVFEIYQRATKNEEKIGKECKFQIETGKRHLPEYELTEEESKKFKDNEDLFWHIIGEGMKEKAPKDKMPEYFERVGREVEVIKFGGVLDYFLILWDIINWADKNGIMHGIGRGSGGGSLVAYLMGLVEVDPMEFGLLFERFLTRERVVKTETAIKITVEDAFGNVEEYWHDDLVWIVDNEGKEKEIRAFELKEGDTIK